MKTSPVIYKYTFVQIHSKEIIKLKEETMSMTRVIAITGCDSGLGWAIAARAAREGIVTVAGMYQGVDTNAAESLRKLCAYPCPLDVTNVKSIAEFRNYVTSLLTDNPNYSKSIYCLESPSYYFHAILFKPNLG